MVVGALFTTKTRKNAAQTILDELTAITGTQLSKSIKDDLHATITYFSNNITKNRMNYAQHVEEKLPIGSGVTEAACKTLVKQRLCGSGMRWKNKGAKGFSSTKGRYKSTVGAKPKKGDKGAPGSSGGRKSGKGRKKEK